MQRKEKTNKKLCDCIYMTNMEVCVPLSSVTFFNSVWS